MIEGGWWRMMSMAEMSRRELRTTQDWLRRRRESRPSHHMTRRKQKLTKIGSQDRGRCGFRRPFLNTKPPPAATSTIPAISCLERLAAEAID
ncbi:hypothetical protein EJ04DRAFT_62654 [Polyplosphaeria fusca]|uniref:Uncharacterized protein n=1 Tax=Polyplosphaeria fusca TaxID=682080 RepID=A0A9P4V6B7_9PLEO|nr:hypothetical protein EJ04DRAFT_62654 [Polyplosphaeria fusca]